MTQISGHVWLREGKRGRVWYAKYRNPDGRQIQRRLGPAWTERSRGPAGHYTRKTAEEALQAILTDARRGTLTGTAMTGATFADAAAEFLRYAEQVRQIDTKTLSDYRGVVRGYLLDEFGETAIEAVSADAIDAYKESLMTEGSISNRTIVRHLTVLHGIFKRAKRIWGLVENPASADLVERPKVVYTGEFDTLDRVEIDRLVAAAATEQEAAIYKTAAFTGLRQGELLALRWQHVDFVGGLLHVRRNFTGGQEKVPKGKRVRSEPMMAEVMDALARLKERKCFAGDDDLVFCSEVGGHVDHFTLRKRYYEALERAELRRIRFHDLRHCFGSAAITKLDPFAVQSYMGHQHYSTTQRYLHHQPRREDALALQEAFGSPKSLDSAGSAEKTASGAHDGAAASLVKAA